MPLDYDYLMGLPPIKTEQRYTARDTMLYALGIGAGLTAIEDPRQLCFVYEANIVALPTMAAVLAYPGFWSREPKYSITWQKILHVEHSVELHERIPIEGHVLGETKIDEIYDRGAEKGALMYVSRRIRNAKTGELLATVRQINLLRADGGFGGPAFSSPESSVRPDGPPDIQLDLRTSPDQALIYRLSGDYNPLHADNESARRAGFERPILHGLASYGIAGRAVLALLCDNKPERLKRFDVRFSSPVYPGETLTTRIWRSSRGTAAVETEVLGRGTVVMRNGYVEFDN